jgi:hypothetical protein
VGVQDLPPIGLANISMSVNESQHAGACVENNTAQWTCLPTIYGEITLEFILWDFLQ